MSGACPRTLRATRCAAVALHRLDAADDLRCRDRFIAHEVRVAAKRKAALVAIRGDGDEAVSENAVAVTVQQDVAGRDLVSGNRCDRDHVAVEDGRIHAVAARAKADRQPGADHVLHECGELCHLSIARLKPSRYDDPESLRVTTILSLGDPITFTSS